MGEYMTIPPVEKRTNHCPVELDFGEYGNEKEFKEYDEETLQKIQQTEMEILKDFIEVCEKHNLTYFGIAGTGIGALRHQGFIPWDDDIDVAMPRDDFERLVRFIEKEKGDKYLIMDTKHYPNYPLMTTRITMRGTKFKEEALKV